jgi:hypothetical protein
VRGRRPGTRTYRTLWPEGSGAKFNQPPGGAQADWVVAQVASIYPAVLRINLPLLPSSC